MDCIVSENPEQKKAQTRNEIVQQFFEIQSSTTTIIPKGGNLTRDDSVSCARSVFSVLIQKAGAPMTQFH